MSLIIAVIHPLLNGLFSKHMHGKSLGAKYYSAVFSSQPPGAAGALQKAVARTFKMRKLTMSHSSMLAADSTFLSGLLTPHLSVVITTLWTLSS